MERVSTITILGAWWIQADGTFFYYSDYADTEERPGTRTRALAVPDFSSTRRRLSPEDYLRSQRGCLGELFTFQRALDRRGTKCKLPPERVSFGNKIEIQNRCFAVSRENESMSGSHRGRHTSPVGMSEWQASFRTSRAGRTFASFANTGGWRPHPK